MPTLKNNQKTHFSENELIKTAPPDLAQIYFVEPLVTNSIDFFFPLITSL